MVTQSRNADGAEHSAALFRQHLVPDLNWWIRG